MALFTVNDLVRKYTTWTQSFERCYVGEKIGMLVKSSFQLNDLSNYPFQLHVCRQKVTKNSQKVAKKLLPKKTNLMKSKRTFYAL